MPQQGVNAITVPGAVDGWQKLADKFGRKKLAEDLAAAIRTAQDGFSGSGMAAAYWAGEVDYLRTDETAAKTYLPMTAPRKWASVSQPGSGMVARADCAAWPGGFL